MLLPRFSIRWVLLLTVVVAVLLLIVRQANQGELWAMAFTSGLLLLVGSFLFYGAVFALVYAIAWLMRLAYPPEEAENPFVVEGQYPPQAVPKNTYGDNL